MSITLFVGDCSEYLAKQATNFDSSAYLVDFSNYKKFLEQNNLDVTAYTSAADLPKITQTQAVFYQVLQKADVIYYCPPTKWSDHTDEFALQNMQQLTEYFLYLLQREKNNVQGLDLSEYTNNSYSKLSDNRKSNQKQLWIAGCSITVGVGVDPDKRFAVLIAENFGGQFVDLAKTGSSMEFAADQILRSDIRQDDIVIWGLTSEYRALIWDRKSDQGTSITSSTFDYKRTNKADDIVDETRLFKAVISYFQVKNFCQKIGAQLIAIPIICSEALQLLLHDDSCYYQIPYMPCFLDLGSDNLHPGPKHHQWYADQINHILEHGPGDTI
jgi:hypothetical protein